MNSTTFKLMHLSIVSNRILLLGLPEFKNGLKADVEVSLMLFFIQVPLVLIYMIEKSLIWADDGQPRP